MVLITMVCFLFCIKVHILSFFSFWAYFSCFYGKTAYFGHISLDAALCYCENYTAIEDIFKGFDSSESTFIRVVRELFSHSLSGNLAYIKSNFGAISSTITCLEAVGAQLRYSLELVKGAEHQIGQAHDKVADRVKSKLENVLFENNGCSALCKISEIFSGNEAQLEDGEPVLNSNDLTVFNYAPVTLCDVERSFSC
jgi:hypothetical protein